MTRRALLLTAMAAPLAAADPAGEVWSLFTTIASALAAADASTFLAAFDRELSGFAGLRVDVAALVENYAVQSTIDPVSNEGDDRARTVELTWLLHLTSLSDSMKVTRRSETIHCRLAKQGRHWKIESFSPLSFFAPPAE